MEDEEDDREVVRGASCPRKACACAAACVALAVAAVVAAVAAEAVADVTTRSIISLLTTPGMHIAIEVLRVLEYNAWLEL